MCKVRSPLGDGLRQHQLSIKKKKKKKLFFSLARDCNGIQLAFTLNDYGPEAGLVQRQRAPDHEHTFKAP